MVLDLMKSGALALALALVGSATHAATLYDQSFDTSTPITGANFSEQGATRLHDDFTSDADWTVTGFTFWGVHWHTGQRPVVEDFAVSIHQNSGGSIGGLLASSFLTFNSVTDTGIDHNDLAGADIYEYAGILNDEITLAAGDYWISIFLQTNAPDTDFAWQRVTARGAGDISAINGNPGENGNLAFRIDGQEVAAVPVPATLPLFLTGLAGLAFITRRTFRG